MADPGNEGPPDSRIVESDSLKYWQGVSDDINGMLGGFPFLHKTDIQGSRSFLAKLGIGLQNDRRRVTNALEAGAG
jgi:protein N-terminal methyltransferase